MRGDSAPPDPALAGILAFGQVIRQPMPTAMSATASQCVRDMTEDELRLAHDAAEALGRLAGLELASRRRT